MLFKGSKVQVNLEDQESSLVSDVSTIKSQTNCDANVNVYVYNLQLTIQIVHTRIARLKSNNNHN